MLIFEIPSSSMIRLNVKTLCINAAEVLKLWLPMVMSPAHWTHYGSSTYC